MSDILMARLRGGTPTFRKVTEVSAEDGIDLEVPVGVDYAHQYNPLNSLESNYDLYYVVLDQEQKEKMVDPYLEALNVGADQIAKAEYNAVSVLYKISGRKLLLTRVNKSSRIGENGKTLLGFTDSGVTTTNISFAIDFSNEVDAYYDGMDRIYFSKFSRAKALFKDFDEFYQEAWYEDKALFLSNNLFEVGEIDPDDISASITQQIADIRANNQLDLDNQETVKKIKDYIRSYPLSGVVLNTNGKIKITTKDDLRCTVKLLTQRYYTSEVTGEVLEARGSVKMRDQKAKKIFNGEEVSGLPDGR